MTGNCFDISDTDIPKLVTFEKKVNDITSEITYIVQIEDTEPFLMAVDFDLDRLAIVGAAPYEAKEYEEKIAAGIDAYNNGFPWLP